MKVLREVLNIVLWMYLKEDEIYSTVSTQLLFSYCLP